MNVLIVGAGIGGLTLAHVLRSRGVQPTIYERQPALPDTGAGIVLATNALAVLQALGLTEPLEAQGRRIVGMRLTDAKGRPLQQLDQPGGALAVHRGALLRTLADGLPIQFSQGASAVDHADWDWVIGADGAHSALRDGLAPTPLRYSGQTCWRCLVPGVLQDHAEERWGNQQRLGIVPLRDHTYLYLVASEAQGSPALSLSELATRFAALHPDLPAWLAQASAPLHHDLYDTERVQFGANKLALLGDAAHALTPNMGQGAGMAIEDAWVLGHALGQPDALRRYAEQRRARVETVWKTSRRIGQIAHAKSPALQALRDLTMRYTPSFMLARQARWLAAGVVPAS